MVHITNMNSAQITQVLSESATAKIISTRIRCARNLSSTPLNPAGSKESRLEVADVMEKTLKTLDGEFAGTFKRHVTMSEAEQRQLVADRLLFKGTLLHLA